MPLYSYMYLYLYTFIYLYMLYKRTPQQHVYIHMFISVCVGLSRSVVFITNPHLTSIR